MNPQLKRRIAQRYRQAVFGGQPGCFERITDVPMDIENVNGSVFNQLMFIV